jgi:MoxR-like ATPase
MKFVGSYTQDFKNLLTASAVSGQNVMTISRPGWGKTEMALQSAKAIDPSGFAFIELDPSTPPEVIRGAYDPAAMLNGQLVRLIKGTPYDPDAHVIILDEIWRANDVVFDALVHATNQKLIDQTTRPVFWGTSNFVGKAERTEALRDRFALWHYMEGNLDAEGIVNAHLNNGTGNDPDWNKDIPSWAECVKIRQQKPTNESEEAVKQMVNNLVDEAIASNFDVNPRRVVQWAEIMFRVSVLYYGSTKFTSVHPNAALLMRYAYPCATKELSIKWHEVAASIADKVGAAIEAYRAIALEKFQEIAKITASGDLSKKTELMGELGQTLAKAQQEFDKIGKGDPRAAAAKSELVEWFSKAVRGEKIL